MRVGGREEGGREGGREGGEGAGRKRTTSVEFSVV